MTQLVEILPGTRRGDTNLEGSVAFSDFVIWATVLAETYAHGLETVSTGRGHWQQGFCLIGLVGHRHFSAVFCRKSCI